MIDTHTHIYLSDLRPEISGIMQRALDRGVNRFYLPNIDVDSMKDVFSLCDAYPKHCFPMVGLHPCSVKEDFQSQLSILKESLSDNRVIAIGEIGIDLYWDKTFLNEQIEAFKIQIEWAKEKKLPIVIHCRNAYHEIYSVLKEAQDGSIKGIFHCFSGSKEEAHKIIDLGLHLGIGGVLTYKNAGLASALENIDLKHIVLETDSPYLTPVPHRGKPNESSYIYYVAEKLADVKGLSIESIDEITTKNAMHIFHAIE